jgi:hypothetical protein
MALGLLMVALAQWRRLDITSHITNPITSTSHSHHIANCARIVRLFSCAPELS